MGIGLSLCRSIVESHRGRMRGQNIYNGAQIVGCNFSFTLPVELPARSEPPTPPPDHATEATPLTPATSA